MNLNIWPQFAGEDDGDGGVRRVVEGQHSALPAHGWKIVDRPDDADLIASHISVPPPYLKLYTRTPLVGHCHGLYWAEYAWDNWAYKANADVMELIRVADAVTAPSEWVAQAIRRHTMRRVYVIPHGVNIDEWEPWKPSGKGCACPDTSGIDFGGVSVKAHLADCEEMNPGGYVLWNKTRPDPVCDPEAVNLIAERMLDVKFRTTFGTATDNVAVTGKLSYALAKLDVQRAAVYLATTRETFGVGTLEALACGVPVVGWRWGAQTEWIEHERDGYLARPGDFEDLEKGIRWALDQKRTSSDTIEGRCRDKAAQFPWRRAAALYSEVYNDALYRKVRHEPTIDPADHWPKVTVIVTAYKLADTLRRALDSVLAQSFPDWECFIVDDASPDECGKIAEDYALGDDRFKVIHNAANLYLSGARNAALWRSRGEYIIPLDADDELDPGSLQVLVEALDSDRTIHVAYGNVEFVEPDGKRWFSGWPIDFEIEKQWQGPGQLGPYCSMFRREVLIDTGGYRERCRSSEDCDVWLRTSSYGYRPKMVTHQTTLIYHNREGSMSRAEGWQEHRRWYPWVADRATAPAGSVTDKQLPIHSCDPPLVSVIIPVGPGHETLVMDAIDSVDAQTFRRWECIVINDTGHEWTRPLPSWARLICNDRACPCNDGDPCNYEDAGPTKAMKRETRGVAAARNAGIAASKGKLFLPLDADDILDPRCLELMLQAHEMTGGEIIYSDFWENPDAPNVYRPYRCPPWDASLLIRGGTVSAVTQLTPKEVWERIGGYDESLPAWEDWAFQIEYAALGLCARRVPIALWTYRKNTGSRRDANYADRETGKAGIIKKFEGRFWDGPNGEPPKETLMACRTCGGGVVNPQPVNMKRDQPPDTDAVLVEYIGPTQSIRYIRGVSSGSRYTVNPVDGPFYVLVSDLETFSKRPTEFRVLREQVAADTAPEGDAPVLAVELRAPSEEEPPAPKRRRKVALPS